MGVVKYTGPVASFHCPTNAEIRSLKVHFSPKQEGTGDPSPENVRPIVGWDGVEVEKKGKNLYKVQHRTSAKANYTETNSGLIVSSTSDGTYCGSHFKLLSVTSKNIGQTFTFSAKCISATQAQRILLTIRNSDNSHFRTVFEKTSDYVYTFTVPNDFPKDGYYQIGYYCTGAVSTSGTTEYSEIQLELGSKATSYEPYHDEMVDYEFGVLGKNKVPFLVNSKTISTQTNGNAGWCNVWKIPNKNLKYTYSAYIDNTNNTVAANVTVWFKNIDNTSYVDGTAKSGTQVAAGAVGRSTITLDASILNNTYYFLFGITSFIKSGETVSCTFSNPMVEIGDTATTYEPYDPKNTVYGGWVDLISGEVCEEWISCNFTSNVKLSASWYSTDINRDTIGVYRNAAVWNNTPYPVPIASGCMFDYCKIGAVYSENTPWVARFLFTSNSFNRFEMRLPKSVLADVSTEEATYQSVKDYLDAHPLQAVYQIAPIHYQLAPTQLQTFLGQNNVWSNADYVEVEYDLHETQEILNRKAFIMANQPHLVVPEAAQLQSFTTDLAAPLKECKAYFKPKQDFNGYDRPWPAGGGKNLLNPASFVRQPGTTSGNTFEVINDTMTMTWVNGAIIANAKQQIIKAGTYTITGFGTNVDLINARMSASDDYSILYTTRLTASKRTFTVEKDFYIELFGLYNDPNTAVFQLQLEAGSTATSYEPYENICPIEGWENTEITRCGKNLCNENTLLNGYIRGAVTSTGTEIGAFGSSSEWKATDFIKVLPNTVYTINFSWVMALAAGLAFYKEPTVNSVISGISTMQMGKAPFTFTTPLDCNYVRFCSHKEDDTVMSLELGDTATQYEPYNGTTIPITFPTEAGTIYGGYVDLVRGEVVATSQIITADGSQKVYGAYDVYNGLTCTNRFILITNLYGGYSRSYNTDASSHFNRAFNAIWSHPDDDSWKYTYNGQQLHMVFENSIVGITEEMSSGERTEKIKNWLIENQPQFIYPLSTPIHYTLTPQQLKTLRSQNNIWSSANDNIEIKYWKH